MITWNPVNTSVAMFKPTSNKNDHELALSIISANLWVRGIYRYIPSKKWDPESILYTFWKYFVYFLMRQKTFKNNHSEGTENIDFT